MSKAVNELLHAYLVEETFCVPDTVNPLSVSSRSSGKQRLILVLRHVNSFIFNISLNVKTSASPYKSFIKAVIYLNLILSQDTITSRFFPRIESSLPSPGILEPVL